MYKLSKNKLSFVMKEPIKYRGSTSLYFENGKTLSCYTVCQYKGYYLQDQGIISGYDYTPVGDSLWSGYDYGKPRNYTLPVYRIDNIPFLKPIPSKQMKKYIDYLYIEGIKLRRNSKINIWEYIYDKIPLKTFKRTAEWVLDWGLQNTINVDHNPANFMWYKSHWVWYDPFLTEEIMLALFLRKKNSNVS